MTQPSSGAWAQVGEGLGRWEGGVLQLASQVLPAQQRLGRLSLPRDLGVSPFLLPTTDNRPKVLALSTSSFQMGQHLAKAEAKSRGPDSSGLQELRESVYTDVLDRTCSQNWQS